MLLGVQVEGRVKEFAHNEALLHLNGDLVSLERSEQDEGDCGVEASELTPDGKESLAHDGGKVALSDEHHVAGSVDSGDEDGGLPETLGVVHAVNNREVLLPLVGVHLMLL